MKRKMTKEFCRGCYNDEYNHGLGGATECWSFKDAKIKMLKEIHINQIPPYKQKPKPTPDCYHRPQFVFWE